MIAYQNIDGGTHISCRAYDIAPTTKITGGQVVRLVEGLVAPAQAAQTGAILGVAAETHVGTEDALNNGSNAAKILVYDNPALLMRCKAPRFTATGGTATTITATELAAFANDDFNGGYLVLVEKAAGSTNTDAIGTSKRITDYAYAASGTVSTFTVESGATAAEGDVYALFPPVGFSKGNLSADGESLVLTATAALALMVTGRIGGEIVLKAKTHTLG